MITHNQQTCPRCGSAAVSSTYPAHGVSPILVCHQCLSRHKIVLNSDGSVKAERLADSAMSRETVRPYGLVLTNYSPPANVSPLPLPKMVFEPKGD